MAVRIPILTPGLLTPLLVHFRTHAGGNPGANLKSISHRCNPVLVAFAWELSKETIILPLSCLQGWNCNKKI